MRQIPLQAIDAPGLQREASRSVSMVMLQSSLFVFRATTLP